MSGKWGRCLLTLAALICVAGSSFGFDGNRKGFVLGAGIGFAPSATWTNSDENIDLSDDARVSQLVIGYAWNDNNMIVADFHYAFHQDDDWNRGVAGPLDFTQGGLFATWYHYFGSRGRSLFAAIGIGGYVFGVDIRGLYDSGSGAGIRSVQGLNLPSNSSSGHFSLADDRIITEGQVAIIN